MREPIQRWRPLAVLVATLLMVLVVAACGDDSSEDASGSSDNAEQASDGGDGIASSSEEELIAKRLKRIEDAFWNGRAEYACDAMTALARDQIASDSQSCEESLIATAKLTENAKVKQRPARVVSVEIDGNKATVAMSDGGRKPVDVPMVKEGGEWKLSNLKLNYDGSPD